MPNGDPENSRIVNKAQLAQLFNRSVTAIDGWIRRGCPYVQRGSKSANYKFDVAEVAEWREKQAVERAVGDTSDLTFDEARRRKTAAEAALVELDLAKARNEYVSINIVAEVVGDQLSACRSRLLTLPTKLAPMVAASREVTECKEILDVGVRDCLGELAGYGDSGGDGETKDPGPPDHGDGPGGSYAAAAEAEDQPVGRRRKAAKPRGKRGTGKVADQS